MNGVPLFLIIFLIVVGGIAFLAITAYIVLGDLLDFIDPRGTAERYYHRMGHSDREARARAEGLSPWHVGLVSALGLAGLLSFFLF